jgi:TIR domain
MLGEYAISKLSNKRYSRNSGNMPLYELALIGAPNPLQCGAVEKGLTDVLSTFGLHLGTDVGWSVRPVTFRPVRNIPAAAAFFAQVGVSDVGVEELLERGTPIIPIASGLGRISAELPECLKPFNCLTFADDGPVRIATALLECVGLLPRQRRVFVSYRRDEAKEAALQLFNFLSSKIFEVFLDTHGILPAEDFQGVLWHRLCDSDVLIMLDTPNYFASRWTSAEFGRALAKGISILRVGWPGVPHSARAATASTLDLTTADVDVASGRLTDDALTRICAHVEIVRGRGHAVRSLNLFSALKRDVECIGGVVRGVGVHNAVHVSLPGGNEVLVYPTVGVPTSVTVHDVVGYASGKEAAILYDHVGLQEKWLKHLTWLGGHIPAARWVRASEAAWTFGGWGAP